MFYHFTRDYRVIEKVGLVQACINFQVFAFYCLALATALSISELRRRRVQSRTGFIKGHLVPTAGVIFFYALLDVFGSTQGNYPLTEHFRYLGHLFGLKL